MSGIDNKLRFYLLTTAVGLVITMGGCAAQNLYARVTTLEVDDKANTRDTAVIKKDVEDFRSSFEEFKRDVREDIQRHHTK